MKKLLLFLMALLTMMSLESCQKQAGPQPNNQVTTVPAQDSLVNHFESLLTGTWKQSYRIKIVTTPTSTTYDTVPAIDTSWTVTFTTNNPVIPSNGYAPYKKDASGKLTEYSNSTPLYYITQWYAYASYNSGTYHLGRLWLPGHGENIARLYENDHLEIEVDYGWCHYNYILIKQ